MGERLESLLARIREAKGPFFVARIHLRVHVPLEATAPDTPEAEQDILRACLLLGFDASPLRDER